MDIVNINGINSAIATMKQFNEMAVTTAKEKLSILLGRYCILRKGYKHTYLKITH